MAEKKERNEDLEIIKDKFGEKFMHLCRSLFPKILETKGLLPKIILEHFEPSRSLYDDLQNIEVQNNFKEYIYGFVDVEQEEPQIIEHKTPEQLLNEAGYDFYECTTDAGPEVSDEVARTLPNTDIQHYRQYYREDEVLCTIYRGGRLNSRRVFWIVKKNVDEIKRENFTTQNREDEYSLSVLSIQFDKHGRPEIISRYNHTVSAPNATLGNNLDWLVPGLENAFRETYGLKIERRKSTLSIPGYVECGGKHYKYNYEQNGTYYCENNVIIKADGTVVKLDPCKYLLFDKYVLDKQKGSLSLKLFDNRLEDNFCELVGEIEKIEIASEKDENNRKTGNQIIKIAPKQGENIFIKIDNCNRMIGYYNLNVVEMPDNCFEQCRYIKKIGLPNLTTMGNYCFNNNRLLTNVDISSLTTMGNKCFRFDKSLEELHFPNLATCGNNCFKINKSLKTIDASNLTKCGFGCFNDNDNLISVVAQIDSDSEIAKFLGDKLKCPTTNSTRKL